MRTAAQERAPQIALRDCSKEVVGEGEYMYDWDEGVGLVTKSCPTLETPWTVAHQTHLSMGFSRQEYWSGLPFPPPGDLPDPGIEPGLLHCRQILYRLSYEGSPVVLEKAEEPEIKLPTSAG